MVMLYRVGVVKDISWKTGSAVAMAIDAGACRMVLYDAAYGDARESWTRRGISVLRVGKHWVRGIIIRQTSIRPTSRRRLLAVPPSARTAIRWASEP